MGKRDWFGLVRFGVDAATLLWTGPAESIELGWLATFGEPLPSESWSLPLGAEGAVRAYAGERFVIVHAASGMAQIRRAPRALGGQTKLQATALELVRRLVR